MTQCSIRYTTVGVFNNSSNFSYKSSKFYFVDSGVVDLEFGRLLADVQSGTQQANVLGCGADARAAERGPAARLPAGPDDATTRLTPLTSASPLGPFVVPRGKDGSDAGGAAVGRTRSAVSAVSGVSAVSEVQDNVDWLSTTTGANLVPRARADGGGSLT